MEAVNFCKKDRDQEVKVSLRQLFHRKCTANCIRKLMKIEHICSISFYMQMTRIFWTLKESLKICLHVSLADVSANTAIITIAAMTQGTIKPLRPLSASSLACANVRRRTAFWWSVRGEKNNSRLVVLCLAGREWSIITIKNIKNHPSPPFPSIPD